MEDVAAVSIIFFGRELKQVGLPFFSLLPTADFILVSQESTVKLVSPLEVEDSSTLTAMALYSIIKVVLQSFIFLMHHDVK